MNFSKALIKKLLASLLPAFIFYTLFILIQPSLDANSINKETNFLTFFQIQTEKIYKHKYISNFQNENQWNEITDVYDLFFQFRLGIENLIDRDQLNKRLEQVIDEIDINKISNLSDYEKRITKAILYGISAFLFVEDSFFTPYFSANNSLDIFEELEEDFPDSLDVTFGSVMSLMYKPLFFEDNFVISSFYINTGDLNKGIEKLDNISFNGNITRIEANLTLIDYYSNILQDFKTSSKYSLNLLELYPKNLYFSFIHAKNLFCLKKYDSALQLFTYINNNIPSKFYPYHYSSLIYEIKCSLYLEKFKRAKNVLKYALSIHKSKIALELNGKITNLDKNNIQILNDSVSESDSLYNNHISLFKRHLRRGEYKNAQHIYNNKLEKNIENYFDKKRIKLLHNILINNL